MAVNYVFITTNINCKLGNSIYNNISKSTRNNLIYCNKNNPFYNIINNNTNLNNNVINNNINPQNIININNQINANNINNEIIEKNIFDKNVNQKNSIKNKNINNYPKNQINAKINNNMELNDMKPNGNIKENDNNYNIINVNNNEIQKNKILLKEKSNPKISNLNSSYILQLKIYFLQMSNVKEESIKRRASFDCRQSTNHFKIFNNQEHIEIKTFDSNYYKIIKQIGKGTYGEIYLVQDPKTLAYYALKKIIITDPIELRDNQNEYKLTWKLTHANPDLKIAKKLAIEIKKLDQYNLVMYVLMEAANCDWEHELLNRQKVNAFYTEAELLSILKSLIYTFSVLQKKGISHRDVKPQNILCFGNKGYKLTDFGEAKKKNDQNGIRNLYGFEQNTSKQTVRGTELYMSPILFRALQTKNFNDAQYNAYKSDVFSLGMCFSLASSLNYRSMFEIREVYDI